jgi:superoxide reductase
MSDAPVMTMTVVDDYDAADDYVKKHTPMIDTMALPDGKTAVVVTVGRDVPHPNVPDHFIGWIGVWAGDSEVARFDLSAVATDPKVSVVLSVDPGTKVTAVESCNLHGLFTYSVMV